MSDTRNGRAMRQALQLGIAAATIFLMIGCQGITSASTPGPTPSPTPAGTPPPTPGSLNTSINHIILFMQENRSFDHYFGQLNVYRAANGLPTDVDTWGPGGTPSGVST